MTFFINFVNAVAVPPGYVVNAQCTFAEIITSISQLQAKAYSFAE